MFSSIVEMTVPCLAIRGGLAVFGLDTPAPHEVVSGRMTMARIGFGAIVGLIGGEAL